MNPIITQVAETYLYYIILNMSILFTGSPEQRALVTNTAEEAYVEVGKIHKVPPGEIHKSANCVDLTRIMVSRLRELDIPAIPVGTPDEIGFLGGEVPNHYHRFVNLGNDWLVDADWQFYLEQKMPFYKQMLANYRIYGKLLPKVLIGQISNFDDLLINSGVGTRYLPSWENKIYQVEKIYQAEEIKNFRY